MTPALNVTSVEVCTEGETCGTCLSCAVARARDQRNFYYRALFETAAAARQILDVVELEPPPHAMHTIEWAEGLVQEDLPRPPKMTDVLDFIAAAYRWLKSNGSWAQHELLLVRAEALLRAAGREIPS